MTPLEEIKSLQFQGIRASMPLDVSDWDADFIAAWIGRHRYDDDPPKVAVALVERLLKLAIDRKAIR